MSDNRITVRLPGEMITEIDRQRTSLKMDRSKFVRHILLKVLGVGRQTKQSKTETNPPSLRVPLQPRQEQPKPLGVFVKKDGEWFPPGRTARDPKPPGPPNQAEVAMK